MKKIHLRLDSTVVPYHHRLPGMQTVNDILGLTYFRNRPREMIAVGSR